MKKQNTRMNVAQTLVGLTILLSSAVGWSNTNAPAASHIVMIKEDSNVQDCMNAIADLRLSGYKVSVGAEFIPYYVSVNLSGRKADVEATISAIEALACVDSVHSNNPVGTF